MKDLKLKLITVLLIMSLILMTSTVVFGTTGSLTVRWVPDVSNAIEGKEVKVTLSITNFNNVDTNLPIEGSAILEYDSSIFSSIKVEGKNSWDATQGASNTLLFSSPMSGGIKEGDIATITLTINSNVTTFDTEIKLNSFELTNDDGMGLEEPNIDITNMNLTAKAKVNSGSDNQEGTTQQPEEDNSGSTENPDTENPSDNNQDSNQDNVQNNNQNEENPNDNNNPATDDDKKPEANEIEKVEDLTVAKDPIPQTGTNYIAIAIIALVVLIGIIAFIRYKKYVQLMNKGV